MARLCIVTAEGQRIVELATSNSLGRHPNNTIQLLDRIVSKEHCVVEQRKDGFWLRDLGSLNGTYINAERVIGEQPLKHRDEIVMGTTRLWYDDGHGLSGQDGSTHQPHGFESFAPGLPVSVSGFGTSTPCVSPPVSVQDSLGISSHGVPSHGVPSHGVPSHGVPSHGSPGVGCSTFGVSTVGVSSGQPSPPNGFRQSWPPQARVQIAELVSGRQVGAGPNAGGSNASGCDVVGPGVVGTFRGAGLSDRPPTPLRPSSRPGIGSMAIPVFGPGGQQLDMSGRVDLKEEKHAIGKQIAATGKSFRAYDLVADDKAQLRADYERLRLRHELSREIALERETTKLLGKILQSIFKFVHADRGVIFLKSEDGKLEPCASLRRDESSGPIVVSSTILNHVEQEKAAVLTADAATDFASSKNKSMILNRITSAIVVPLLHNDNFLGALWLDSASLAQFQTKDLEMVTGVAAQAAMFIENNTLAKKIERELVTRERFSRLLSPNLAERVISGELEVKKGGEFVQECTVFNSDIRGFTRMSATEKPEVIVEMLNEYFESMVETLFEYEGTLDKFMGDGLMALWGAPIVHPDDASRAVDCALGQMANLGHFNRERVDRNLPQLGIGIGIHTGPLVAGYIGSSRALSYTVIGDTVNTSARLCSHAKTGQILVSQETRDRLGGRFVFEELAPANLKGKEAPVAVFNVLGRAPFESVPDTVCAQ